MYWQEEFGWGENLQRWVSQGRKQNKTKQNNNHNKKKKEIQGYHGIREIYSDRSGDWESEIRVLAWVDSEESPPLGYRPLESSHGRKSVRELFGGPLYKGTKPIHEGSHAHKLVTAQRPHLLDRNPGS